MFNEVDYAVVRQALARLPEFDRCLVELHFWSRLSATDLASGFGITWQEVEDKLKESYQILREACVKNPSFSRSQIKHPCAA